MGKRYLGRDELVAIMSVDYADAPVIGIGEDWTDGLIAVTGDKRKALKALKDAADDNYIDPEYVTLDVMQKRRSTFEYNSELFGDQGGWQFAPDAPKSAPKVTYWMLDV